MVLWRNVLCSSAGTMRSFFFCWSFFSLFWVNHGEHSGLRRSAFEVLCSYLCSLSISPSLCFITFLKLKMYWFSPDVVISSRQKSISMSLATCCCCHCIFPLKSGLSFSINGSLIIEAAQVDKDAGHVRAQHIRRFLSPPTAWGGSTNQQLRTKPLYF